MKKALCFILISIVLCGCTSGAAISTTEEENVYCSFTDSAGNQVTLTKKPQKVAVLFSSLADLWISAGGELSVTVGETVDRGFADNEVLLVDDGAGKTINEEALVSYEPDLVIGTADLEAQVSATKLMAENGIPSAVFSVDSFEDYLQVLKIFTDITGDAEAYAENGEKLKEKIDSIIEKCSEEAEKTEILFIRAGSSADSTKAKTAVDNFVCGMLNELNTYNIAENAPVLLDGLSFEEVINEDPEFILVSTMGKEEAAKAYMDSVISEDTWSSLSAVKGGKLYYLPKDLFQYKPNARWAEAYEYLAKLLYPSLF